LRQRRKARRTSHMRRPRLYEYVDQKLRLYWSPEQIAHRIRIDFPDDLSMRLCHETLYRFILREARGYIRFLRQGNRRNRYAWRGKKRFKRIRNTKSIEQRPVEVEQRSRCGDWEADRSRKLCGRPSHTGGQSHPLPDRGPAFRPKGRDL
jgi:IS30 family transposase